MLQNLQLNLLPVDECLVYSCYFNLLGYIGGLKTVKFSSNWSSLDLVMIIGQITEICYFLETGTS